jgi:hypothetical protein
VEAILYQILDFLLGEPVTRAQQYLVLSAKEHTIICGKNKVPAPTFI